MGDNDDQEDGDLFRREMVRMKVNPHGRRHDKLHDKQRQVAPKPAVTDSVPDTVAAHVTASKTRVSESAGGVLIDKTDQGEYVEFARGGLQKKVIRKLKRGEYTLAADLDLHGHTVAEAERLLNNFLRGGVHGPAVNGSLAVLIIHGKGLRSGTPGGVLKNFTLNFLKRHDAVKAFCSALPKDGGTGAVYVLLRR